jgi:hypothetical protein
MATSVSAGRRDIFCDSALDNSLKSMDYQGFRVKICSSLNTSVPFYLHPNFRVRSQQGVGIFVLPTQAEYTIIIESIASDSNTFTIESIKVGDEPVTINKNQEQIYYDNRTANIGGGRAFVFYSPSQWEVEHAKVNPRVNADILKTVNKNNVVSLTLQHYKRISKQANPGFQVENNAKAVGFGGACGFGFDSGFGFHAVPASDPHGRQFGSFGFGAPVPAPTPRYDKKENKEIKNSSSLASGTTISDTRFTVHIPTVEPVDTYIKVGSPVSVTLQLVCLQSESDKKRDNLKAKLKSEGFLYWSSVINNKKAEVEKKYKELEQLNMELNQARVEFGLMQERNSDILKQLSSSLALELLFTDVEKSDDKEPEAVKIRKEQQKQDLLLQF